MTPERIELERESFERFLFKKFELDYDDLEMRDVYFRRRKNGEYLNDTFTEKFDIWLARAAQSEWISVEDRPPEKEGYYLTCAIGCAVRICQFDGTYFSYQQYDEEEWEFVEVIWFPDYWLSIPFPPTTDPAA